MVTLSMPNVTSGIVIEGNKPFAAFSGNICGWNDDIYIFKDRICGWVANETSCNHVVVRFLFK